MSIVYTKSLMQQKLYLISDYKVIRIENIFYNSLAYTTATVLMVKTKASFALYPQEEVLVCGYHSSCKQHRCPSASGRSYHLFDGCVFWVLVQNTHHVLPIFFHRYGLA